MTRTRHSSISQVLTALTDELGSDFLVVPILTRVALRTGVNLKNPRPDQRTDLNAIDKTVSALNEMGYLR